MKASILGQVAAMAAVATVHEVVDGGHGSTQNPPGTAAKRRHAKRKRQLSVKHKQRAARRQERLHKKRTQIKRARRH